MAKSKYPQALDTSKELPPIRDNITEIGSETLNGLRDAILNIERTLGINPQGSVGNSVSSRLNNSLDSSGNIKKEALTKANVLSGPITNVDVANSAAISESKLRLTFPTQLLQDELSVLNGELDSLVAQIESLNATLSAHVHPDSANRHNAVAITVKAATITGSSESFSKLESETLQSTMEGLVNGHINFAGNTSSSNNSHIAEQIYFDTSDVSDVITQDSMQGALEDLANLEGVGIRNNTLNLSSNGRVRTGSVYNAMDEDLLNTIIISSAAVSFSLEDSRTRFTFDSAQTPTEDVQLFDYLNLSNSDLDEDNKSYQIAKIIKSGANISALIVFGNPLGSSVTGMTATVSKNPYVTYNSNGLNSTVRPRFDRTNTPDIIIANPNAATIISSGIFPSKVEAATNSFNISIEGGTPVTIETYDSNVGEQTLHSVINKINEQSVDQHLNFLAYRIRSGDCHELAISHILPNSSGDVSNRTIEISTGTSNDGTTILGLSGKLDEEVSGSAGNTYHINGLLHDSFGRLIELTSDDIEMIAGSNTISLFSGTFKERGVRAGDLVVITGSTDSSEDGTYRISNVNNQTITLDRPLLSLVGPLTSSGMIHILRVSASVGEMTFTEAISSNGSIVFDTFISEDKDVHYYKRIEVDGALLSGGFSALVSDVSRGFITGDEQALITVTTAGIATLTDPSLAVGPSVFIGQTGEYKLFASDGLSYVILSVNGSAFPTINLSVDIYGFDEINSGNLRTCRATFATSLGRVLGEYTGVGIPSVLDKRRSGTVDESIVGESLLEKYIEGPRNELRASGIIRGLGISNVNLVNSGLQDSLGNDIFYYEVDIDAGIAIVNGIRFEISGFTAFRFNTDQDFYIAINSEGCIIFGNKTVNPDGYTDGYTDMISPLVNQEVANLGFVDTGTGEFIDLRYFIDKLDLKSGRIIVSKTQNFGHFTELAKGIEYARRFTELHPNQGTPMVYIDQGDYSVNSTIIIDFDVKICGAGSDTVLSKSGSFATGTEPISGNIDFGDTLFLIGSTSELGSTRIENGITLSDFTYKGSETLTAVSSVISITHPSVKTGEAANRKATYRVQNVNFLGSSLINYGTGADNELVGEYAIALGQTDSITFTPISTITMGGLIVTGCRFDKMGVEKGAIIFSESASSQFENIIISGNIGTLLSPNIGDVTFEILKTPTVPTLTNVIEANNART